jgi:DNA-binding MarR family transcriptional regulator
VGAPACEPDAAEPGAGTADLDVAAGLVQLTSLVQGIYARIAERHGLTPAQAKLLCVVADGPRGMAELAQSFGVEKAAMTGLVDRVERRGLAARSTVPGDRRALRVTPTDNGRAAAAAFHAEVSAALTRVLAPLAADDREQFRTAIAKIITECRTTSRRTDAPTYRRTEPVE